MRNPDDTVAPLIDRAALEQALRGDVRAVKAFRDALKAANDRLAERFRRNEAVETLVADRAHVVDEVILASWRCFAENVLDAADLVAVGGYGRGELHPQSDIDFLVLIESASNKMDDAIGRFLTFLWDIGLEVGHSVRTLDDCEAQARSDVTVLTTLMETRLLHGPGALFEELPVRIAADRMWNSAEFFHAKLEEQRARHARYHDTAYNLEPNVKGSPGGLRDIQMIGWLAQRHLGTRTLAELVPHKFLTEGQLRILSQGRAFLWRIRFGLHLLTGRREDRLLFDHQVKLAQMLGYEDASFTLAVEQLMQRYYRTVMELSRLNEMLLQLFEEAILLDKNEPPVPLGPRFQSRNGYLEATDDQVFAREPSALLEMFLLLEQNLDLRGVNARTIALVKQHLWLIDEEFRQNPRHHRLFLDILRAPHGVIRTLRRMNTYGVLGLYIPAFGRIVGRMQYDLFHAYTVDAHTLFVVSNLRRLAMAKYDHEFPELSRIMQSLPKQELAYLAAIFHDIAKGRGGDHSELGSVDAEAFCLEQGLSPYDARLVAWLVRNHLVLSVTAQKKDISDPKVIHELAQLVGDQNHLDYLYVLTVADVRGTNPKLWNNWKASLFAGFYQRTREALRRGLESPIDQDQLIAETQARARALIGREGLDGAALQAVWQQFTDAYFLRHTPEEIAWHTRMLAQRDSGETGSFVSVEQQAGRATGISTYSSHRQHSFARTTSVLDQLGLTIVDARITPTADGSSLDVYHVLEDTGDEISDPVRIRGIQQQLAHVLSQEDHTAVTVTRRAPRQVRMFSTPTQITFVEDPVNRRTIVELIAGDRPGLLSQIAKVFMTERVDIYNSKIMTVGERAEDVFYVADESGRPLTAEAQQRLAQRMTETLDRRT